MAKSKKVKAVKAVAKTKPIDIKAMMQGTGKESALLNKTKPIVLTEFRAMVKAKKNDSTSLLVGYNRPFQVGKVIDLDFDKVKLPKAIMPVLQSLYTQYGIEKVGSYQFSVKAGYGNVQLGYNRAGHSSWKGLLALNDGQFCTWSWAEKGLTFEKICKLGNDAELTRHNQGKNWVTFHYGKDNTDNLIAYGQAVMAVISQ